MLIKKGKVKALNEKILYPHSLEEAKRNSCVDLYKESHSENIACKTAIEETIKNNFDGLRLKAETAKDIIKNFGFDRVTYVLSATLQNKDYDGRFSRDNKAWAKETFVPEDTVFGQDRRLDFMVQSHPAVLDGVVNQVRREIKALELWDKTQINPTDNLNFEGKVMVLSPTNLKDQYKTREDQLIFCTNGIGCNPDKSGRKVYGFFLKDGEEAQFYRQDFLGEAKHEHLSQTAKEQKIERLIDFEASRILTAFRTLDKANSPNKTHFMVKVSPDYINHIGNFDKVSKMLPFKSLSFSTLKGEKGIYGFISKDEDRTKPMREPRVSVKEKLTVAKKEIAESANVAAQTKDKEER